MPPLAIIGHEVRCFPFQHDFEKVKHLDRVAAQLLKPLELSFVLHALSDNLETGVAAEAYEVIVHATVFAKVLGLSFVAKDIGNAELPT